MNVLVFGDLNIDLFFPLDLPVIELKDLSYVAQGFFMSPGGGAGNVGVALRRLGQTPIIFSTIGNDLFGEIVRTDLVTEGIDVSFIKKDDREPTGIMVVLLRKDGKRTIIGYRGANAYNVIDEDILHNISREVNYVYISGFTRGNVDRGQSIVALLRYAKRAGAYVGIDLGGIDREFLRILGEYKGAITDVFLNRDELELLLGGDALSSMKSLANHLKPSYVFLKLGKGGAVVFHGGKAEAVGPVKVDRVVDTTGCGDAFNAGAIYGLSLGLNSTGRALLGNVMGAYKATGFGARHYPKNLAELREFVARVAAEAEELLP